MTQVSDVMAKDQVYCTSDTRIAEIKHLMKKYNYEEIVVVDTVVGKHPIGVIHEEDVTSDEVEHSALPSDISAKECMVSVSSVQENSSVEECLLAMEESHKSRLPVVNQAGQFVGVVSLNDIVV
jgi:CBS domain-containing protein